MVNLIHQNQRHCLQGNMTNVKRYWLNSSIHRGTLGQEISLNYSIKCVLSDNKLIVVWQLSTGGSL